MQSDKMRRRRRDDVDREEGARSRSSGNNDLGSLASRSTGGRKMVARTWTPTTETTERHS